jgi:hypothetical protein
VPRFADLDQRISVLYMRARASDVQMDRTLLTDMADVLLEGYLRALRAESSSRRLDERMQELLASIDGDPDELRWVALQRRSIDASVRDVRRRLATVRIDFVRLGGDARDQAAGTAATGATGSSTSPWRMA